MGIAGSILLIAIAYLGVYPKSENSIGFPTSRDNHSSRCLVHIGKQGQPAIISLYQAPNTEQWPLFSNSIYSFAYPPGWSVSTAYSSTTGEYESYVVPWSNYKNQLGTAVTFSHKVATPAEVREDFSSHDSLPTEEVSCVFRGVPATIFNESTYLMRAALFNSNGTAYVTLNDPGQASTEELDAFRAVLNSLVATNSSSI